MSLERIEDALRFIDSVRVQALSEAQALFPDHPKAWEVWAKLCALSGGIEEVVQTLGLEREYSQYQHEFTESVKMGCKEAASIQLLDFTEFCKEQVMENFYLFK